MLGECLLTTVLECRELVLGGESGVTSRLPSRSIPPLRAELKFLIINREQMNIHEHTTVHRHTVMQNEECMYSLALPA